MYKVFRLVPLKTQMRALSELEGHPGLDFWSPAQRAGRPVDVRVAPDLQQSFKTFLERLGVPHEVLIEDLERVLQRERSVMASRSFRKSPGTFTSFTEYLRYDEIRQYLAGLASRYPNMVTLETIGETYEGRPIDAIQISSGGGGSRPVIFIDACIHAREWLSTAAALYVIHQLVENATERALTDSVDWHIVPVLNPDGYEYTFTTDRMWRKTRSRAGHPWCVGVDANRNFGFHWNEVGTRRNPCAEIYAGPRAFYEREILALGNYLVDNADRIKLYLSFHSYGPFILYPWGFTTDLPDNWKTLDALAREANAAQVAAGGPNYDIGSSANVLYGASGASDDWVKGVVGIPLSYTIELPAGGSMGFNPPPSDILKLVQPFFEAVRVFGKYIADNFGEKNISTGPLI